MNSRALIIVLCLSLLRAQQPAGRPTTPSSGEAKFSVTSRLVVVSVIVKDRDGKPIENLKPADFTLLEDNTPQRISVFEYQRIEEQPTRAEMLTPPRPPARPAAPPPKLASAKPVTAPPKEAAPTVRYKDRRLLVLFFDFSSMPPEDQLRAQKGALKFVQEQIAPADVVSIMTFTNRLRIAQDFTADRGLLAETISAFKIGDASELAAEGDTAADDTDETAYTVDDTEFNVFNTDRKLGALESAAKMLGGFAEKKALVYFSSGVGKTGVENQSQLRATVNAAVRANISFYPVDARGLAANAPLGNASQAAPRGTGAYTGQAQRRQRERFNDQQETLYTLAADTGGKALLDSNDLSLGIVQAQRDISSYYILGYYSTNAAEDGKFRRVRVRLDRYPQAKLDFRSGYFAPKHWRDFNSSDKERQLEEALMLGDPITDLPLVLEVNWFRLLPDRYFIPVAVKIPGSALDLARKRGGEETELDFIGQIKDEKGRPAGSLRDAIKVKLAGEQAAQLTRRHLEYDAGFVLTPGKYSLRFLARENQSGKMGTFETSFTVPDMSQQRGYVKMSSVVWANQREPLAAAVGAAGRNQRMAAMHPLVSDGKKLIPSITRVFRKDQSLFVYFEVYDPLLDGGMPDIRATVSFFRGKIKAFETGPVNVTQGAVRRQAARIQLQVPLAALEPGNYTCQVNVIDQTGKMFGFARSAIVLLPEKAAGRG